MAAMRNSSILLIAGEYRMNNEENKGTLPEDDVGRPEETTDIEDRINATLDKILDDDEDEFDDIQVDYEDPEDEEPDNEVPDEENREIRETEDDYEKTKVWTDSRKKQMKRNQKK